MSLPAVVLTDSELRDYWIDGATKQGQTDSPVASDALLDCELSWCVSA